MTKYIILGASATMFALALLSMQIIGGLEYTQGGTPFATASMIGAMLTVAVLPVAIHASWHVAKGISIPLFVAFLAFLAYSFPANLGRIGELKEAKVAAATDVATLKSELANIQKTLRYAEPDQARECEGATLPIVPPAWPECRRKTGTVKALHLQRAELEAKIAKAGSELGDTGSDTLAWVSGLSASHIRRVSTLGFAIGLEIAIWALAWLASVSYGKALSTRVARGAEVRGETVSKVETLQAITEEPTLPSDEELETLRRLLLGRGVLSNQDVAELLGCSKSEASKTVSEAVAAGLVSRVRHGRRVAISANTTVH